MVLDVGVMVMVKVMGHGVLDGGVPATDPRQRVAGRKGTAAGAATAVCRTQDACKWGRVWRRQAIGG